MLKISESNLKIPVQEAFVTFCIVNPTFMSKSISLYSYVSYDILASVDKDNHPHRSVSLLVKETVPQSHVILNSTLKAVAARVTLHHSVTIC